jgi:FkbM family methyltransferase
MRGATTRITEKFRREGAKGIFRALASRLGFAVDAPPMEHALRKLISKESVAIVQIGAFIGDTSNDPIYGFLQQWLAADKKSKDIKIVLVEPVREYFDQLKLNYSQIMSDCIHCENVAVAEVSGPKDFFRLGVDPREHGFPDYLKQLGSLRADRMTRLWDRYEADEKIQKFYLEHRIVETVDCVTFEQLLARHHISQVDILQIDAEGYDYEILKSIDFSIIKPTFINYERVLLNEDEPKCREMLVKAGYRLRDCGQDTFCALSD